MKRIIILSLLVIFSPAVYGKKIASLKEVLQPFYITIGSSRLYIVEKKPKVHIYDFNRVTDKVSYLNTFGNEGQGPGEFSLIHRLKVLKNKLAIPTWKKYAEFTLDGVFIDEIRITVPVQKNKIEKVGDHFVAGNFIRGRGKNIKTNRRTIRLYDQKLNLIKELKVLDIPTISMKINLLSPSCLFSVKNQKIYIITGDKKTSLEIFDQSGNLLDKKITQLGVPELTDEFKENLLSFYKKDRGLGRMPERWKIFKELTYFPDYCPDLEYAWIFGQHIYVKTYRRKNKLAEYVIFDLKGNKLKSGYAYDSGPGYQGQPFCFIKDEIIYLKMDEEGENWELHRELIQFTNNY